ncbi:MAG: sporulation protein YjcZ [Bacillota bacterium]
MSDTKGFFGGFGDNNSLLFFFLLLVIIFCNCGLFGGYGKY